MKEILATLVLLLAVLVIYMSTVGGDEGLEDRVRNGGGRIHTTIERLNP
jgi:hypothetical protein